MKVCILAGGRGSRLSEETKIRPKPLVEIGGRPILWHIMNHYSWFDHDQFCIALGYKGGMIKDYFRAHHGPNENVSLDYNKQSVSWRSDCHRDWKLNFLETGLETKTGGRIKRLKEFVGNETFLLTWGDAVADIDLNSLIDFHRSHGKLATLTAVRPPARFGRLTLLGDRVSDFAEKQNHPDDWISGAYFVLEPEVFSYIDGDHTEWERGPLERLARDNQLMAYRHDSFWQCMDTIQEKEILEDLWRSGEAPWAFPNFYQASVI